jgi:filamentous hemagglutinin family protein
MMESVKKILGGRFRGRAVVGVCVLIACLALIASAPVVFATPSGGTFTVGTGTIDYGTNTAVTVNQAQSVIQWGTAGSGGIDTSSAETLTFSQAAGLSNSAVLNRIMSGNPTQFDGVLNGADMRIFIVNPAGIVFGSGSQVNVSQLVASGLNMSDADFLNATGTSPTEYRFEGGDGTVSNNSGVIRGDSVILVGKKVINLGAIVASNGLVVLAAGDNVYLAQDGSSVVVQLLQDPVDVDPANTTADIQNRSVINAGSGKIILAAGDTFSRAISNVGILAASSGTIEAHAAQIENNGWIDVSASSGADADGGTITLNGTESVSTGANGLCKANAGANGAGGTITLKSAGTVTVPTGSQITARGGSTSGGGGTVKIIGGDFMIAGDIDASPANVDYDPGTLEVDAANVTIANGANAGATDTLYEQDIETMGNKGTGIAVYATDSITVQDILDDKIAGRYGNIELYGTGADSSISFADTGDTISTTLGDIIMDAGSGGLTIGSLQTAKDVSDVRPTPGQILLSTHDKGDITAENLTIASGWGQAQINVTASHNLTINGDVAVGKDSPIENIPLGQDAEALINLKAGDSVVLNGNISADSYGLNEAAAGGVTRSYIGVFSGTDQPMFGDATINGNLVATAKSSSQGTSDATIELDVWGALTWGPSAADPVADADTGQVHVASKQSTNQTDVDGDVAGITVNVQANIPQPVGTPDLADTHMETLVEGNVLTNDVSPQGDPLTAALVDAPTHAASFTLNPDGSYSYTPETGYVGTDTFTYTASAAGATSAPVTVTITMTNTPPVIQDETQTTHMGTLLQGTIADNISDPEGDPFTAGLVTTTQHGTLTVNQDGTYSYQPDPGYTGSDSFTISAWDDQIGETPTQGTVTITMTNTGPTAVSDSAITTYAAPVVIGVLGNDTDPEHDPLSVSSFNYTGAGTVVLNANNTLTYTPPAGFLGKDSFTYSVTDGQTGEVPTSTTVSVMVTIGRMPPPEYFMPTGPNLDKTDVKTSGCPALMKWAAAEFGVDHGAMQISSANGLASGQDIQPCEACQTLRHAATILADPQGVYANALAQVINEFAPSALPPTEEQMASIADAIASHAKIGNRYALAGEYLTALSDYVTTLNSDIGLSADEAVKFASDKYLARLSKSGNTGVATYVAARLKALSVFLSLSQMEPLPPAEPQFEHPTLDFDMMR